MAIIDDIRERVKQLMKDNGGGAYGSKSWFGQVSDVNSGLSYLKDYMKKNDGILSEDDKDALNKYKKGLQAQKGNAIAGSALSIADGLTDITNTGIGMTRLGDTSVYDNSIGMLQSLGNAGYENNNQIEAGYEMLDNFQPDIDFDTIRGGSTRERVGDVLSTTMSGASTGLAVGGPWGALIGGAIGAGAGAAGWLAGDALAQGKQMDLSNQAEHATRSTELNLAAASEANSERQFRQGAVNSTAQGGSIQKMSISEFAEKELRVKRQKPEFKKIGGVERRRSNGGTVIRFK